MRTRARTSSLALAGLLALGSVAACTEEEGAGGAGIEREGESEVEGQVEGDIEEGD